MTLLGKQWQVIMSKSKNAMSGAKKKEDKEKILNDRLEAFDAKFKELEEVIASQKETIQGLKDQQVQLEQDAQAAKVRVLYMSCVSYDFLKPILDGQ